MGVTGVATFFHTVLAFNCLMFFLAWNTPVQTLQKQEPKVLHFKNRSQKFLSSFHRYSGCTVSIQRLLSCKYYS